MSNEPQSGPCHNPDTSNLFTDHSYSRLPFIQESLLYKNALHSILKRNVRFSIHYPVHSFMLRKHFHIYKSLDFINVGHNALNYIEKFTRIVIWDSKKSKDIDYDSNHENSNAINDRKYRNKCIPKIVLKSDNIWQKLCN